ncbi:C45 family autoproteolytic acyltransferase/hydolase [Algoriphagus chordae]|uniref:Tetratricopeptide repeat protein n=1 Tax=Algoriphagus chordae TaxID=237019 RepID=A0A2W7QJR5_9BACT|nr:C45 family autoproteolytic acyltransferase/hydolase [Algoriphagus chordae]PZX48714.1 tetratricopeptide repeat protein [Algoriphagus chordae]
MVKLTNLFSGTLCLFSLSLMLSCGVSKSLHDRPDITSYDQTLPQREELNDSVFSVADNFLTKNVAGQWELYVSGDPYHRGLVMGSLTQELLQYQEDAFFGKVETLVPSKFKQYFLRKFLAWYNRKMYRHIPEEYKAEIYGLSKYAGDEYDNIAPAYMRGLYLHGAHDIGHALQDLALVGCSSFAAWGDRTEDGSLIIGRNFDFYAGDDFSKNKIIAFVNPTDGYKFMSVTWAGMIGITSGMNVQGLTVTINAGKSDIPWSAKTPISIVTREILQYASNIEEAIAIAKKRSVFVSESIFIGSASDNRAILIETSPDNFGVFEVPNSNQLICTNHFQSEAYSDDKHNAKHIVESHSLYRYERLEELLGEQPVVTPQIAADILRNTKGLENSAIGYGNEKALNQLLAHHAVIFKPAQGLVWVSSNPYQLGDFVAYDLNKVFAQAPNDSSKTSLQDVSLLIEKDPFIYTEAYQRYQEYRLLSSEVAKAIEEKEEVSPEILEQLKASNPDFWEAYYLRGQYYQQNGNIEEAIKAYEEALTKEVTTLTDKENIEKQLKKLKRK